MVKKQKYQMKVVPSSKKIKHGNRYNKNRLKMIKTSLNIPIRLSLHDFRKVMSVNPTESCLDCGTPLELTLAGQKKKPCHKCGAYRRKREYL